MMAGAQMLYGPPGHAGVCPVIADVDPDHTEVYCEDRSVRDGLCAFHFMERGTA